MKTKLINLNNKSRKGLYLYIKEKGQPARYYKYEGRNKEAKILEGYYKRKYKQKKATEHVTQYKNKRLTKKKDKVRITIQKTKKTIQKAKRKGEIKDLIKKGVHTETINNPHKTTNYQQAKHRSNLIKKSVDDKSMVKILSEEQNFNKLKNRLEYEITGYSREGDKTITATRYGNTLRETITEIKKTMLTEQETREGFTDPLLDNLIAKGWKNARTLKNDETVALRMKITLRKGWANYSAKEENVQTAKHTHHT